MAQRFSLELQVADALSRKDSSRDSGPYQPDGEVPTGRLESSANEDGSLSSSLERRLLNGPDGTLRAAGPSWMNILACGLSQKPLDFILRYKAHNCHLKEGSFDENRRSSGPGQSQCSDHTLL